jgi:hypothetical protein
MNRKKVQNSQFLQNFIHFVFFSKQFAVISRWAVYLSLINMQATPYFCVNKAARNRI